MNEQSSYNTSARLTVIIPSSFIQGQSSTEVAVVPFPKIPKAGFCKCEVTIDKRSDSIYSRCTGPDGRTIKQLTKH